MKVPATSALAGRQPTAQHAAAQADYRPTAVAQRRVQAALDASPHRVAQRQEQAALDASPRQVAQRQQAAALHEPNRTGLPNQLKAGVESLSGHSLDDVRVHYNSAQPAQLQASAYAQGSDIHVAPGQEQYLPHEAWHVVQQKQGRVRPTQQVNGAPINDEASLEQEADAMGRRATQLRSVDGLQLKSMKSRPASSAAVQRSASAPIQFGRHEVFRTNKMLDENDELIAEMIAKDLDSIVENAAHLVDTGQGSTRSAAAYMRDRGTRAAGAKRGTAIHAEAYALVDNQLDGYGGVETKCQKSKGRIDVLITLPSGNKVVYDITSLSQAMKAHTGGRSYEKESGVILIYEISYDDY